LSVKSFLRATATFIVPPLGALLMRLFYLSYKKTIHVEGELPQTNAVFVGWHGELFVNPVVYKKFRTNYDSYAVISHHFDGELIAKTFYYAAKIKAIRGSSRKGAKAALVGAIKTVANGDDVILTPDGPRGPRHKFQHGALAIAKRTGGNIVIITTKAHNCWQLNSWDKFMIPKPFSKVEIYMQSLKLERFDETAAKEVEQRMLRYAL